jgi:hypothetical protein
MELNDKYLVLLRRELVRASARLRRAEREADQLRGENVRLRARLDKMILAAAPVKKGRARPSRSAPR